MGLQVRRGTNAERLLITPLQGELIYTTDTKEVYVGDGSTLGGVKISTSGIDFNEVIQDIVGGMFTGASHAGIVFTYDDVDGKIDANVGGSTFAEGNTYKINIAADDSTIIVDTDSQSVTASGGFFGNLIADDFSVLVDSNTGNISNKTLNFIGDVITGTTSAVSYDGLLDPVEPIIAVGTAENPQVLFVEGNIFPIIVRGRATNTEGATITVQGSRYDISDNPIAIENADYYGQIAFDGYNGSTFRRGAVLSAISKSSINSGQYDSDLQVSVLNQDGLYRQFTFGADGFLRTDGLKVFSASEAELSAISSISDEGSIGYGAERKSVVFFDGLTYVTVANMTDVPLTPGSDGKRGQIAADATHLYICYSTNNWIRVPKDGAWI